MFEVVVGVSIGGNGWLVLVVDLCAMLVVVSLTFNYFPNGLAIVNIHRTDSKQFIFLVIVELLVLWGLVIFLIVHDVVVR